MLPLHRLHTNLKIKTGTSQFVLLFQKRFHFRIISLTYIEDSMSISTLLSIFTLATLTERATLRVTVVTMLLFTQTLLFLALLPRILKF